MNILMKKLLPKVPKIIVICGQTATGKSSLAIDIAKNLKKEGIKAEIISADSRQVYKGFDLGSGKITQKEMQGIPHHMLDVASPKKVFSVSSFQKLANKKIKEILSRNHIPIICGGTGFYIDALIYETNFPKVKPNSALRKELDKLTTTELFNNLQKIDIIRSETIDPHNRPRLIRAIEIASSIGAVPPLPTGRTCGKYDVLWIGLKLEPEILKQKIAERLNTRIKLGMVAEMQSLHNPPIGKGVSWKRLESFGLEYKWCSLLAQNKITKEECIENLNKEIYQYAKRQLTWFKRNKEINWIDVSSPNTLKKSKSLVNNF